MRRVLAGAAAVIAGLLVVGHCSGDQPRRDAVEAARRETGVALESSRIDVGDVTLHVVQGGPADGKPVVLLHGFPEFWYAWKGVIRPLTDAGYRVILPDQRGYGGSDKPRGVASYHIDELGDDIANLIAALGHERAFVVAHDWGGGVAWNLAIRHPERVAKLAVLDTPHPDAWRRVETRDETTSWFRTYFQIPWLPEESSRWGNWYLLSNALRNTSAPGAFPDDKLDLYRSAWDHDGAFGTMVNWYRAGFRYYTRDPNAPERRVTVPTLVLAAAHDAFIAGNQTRASVELCDDGELVELGTGTHWVAQEEPERIAGILIEFFQ